MKANLVLTWNVGKRAEDAGDVVVEAEINLVGHLQSPQTRFFNSWIRQVYQSQLTRDADRVQHNEASISQPFGHIAINAQFLRLIRLGPGDGCLPSKHRNCIL